LGERASSAAQPSGKGEGPFFSPYSGTGSAGDEPVMKDYFTFE